MKVGIVGGTGKMGRLFSGVFGQAGCEVSIAGRHTSVTARDLAARCDIVVISVPIRHTIGVIRDIAPFLTKEQLFCDLTSLKIAPVNAMLESDAMVIGLHPMFGPTVPGITGQTIIATPARCSFQARDSLLGIFESQGARITLTTPDEHDRMMAIVQGLTHFVTLTIAETMRKSGIDPKETMRFTSPVYQIELGLVGRLLAQDQSLYADILQMNPYVPMVLSQCEDSVKRLRETIETLDPEQFASVFAENARHFGVCALEGMQLTDDLIRHMVGR